MKFRGEGERTPSAVEPAVDPKASPTEKSSRSQPSMTSKMAPVSAVMAVATSAEKQPPSSSASAIACTGASRLFVQWQLRTQLHWQLDLKEETHGMIAAKLWQS